MKTELASGFKAGQTAISNTVATRIVPVPDVGQQIERGVRIKNLTGNAAIYIGGSDVLSSTGWPLLAEQELLVSSEKISEVYGLATTNNHRLAWLWT